MTLSYDEFYDKVLGGWVGKSAGGILGAPIEGLKRFNDIPLSDQLFETTYPNDDLDLQVLWLDLAKRCGPLLRETDLAEHWLAHVGFPWNEYGIATRNLRLGLYPPDSGRHNNAYWRESMGCPIRSEIWGMLNPGQPERAAFYARMDATLDHDGFSVEAEQFLSACAALAFFEKNIPTLFRKALLVTPASGLMRKLVKSVLRWHESGSYRSAMGKIKSYWGDADFTSAPMNVGFTLLALLHRGQDFGCVMDALHLGHDADCVSATAGALVGIMHGYSAIPDTWKRRVGDELVLSAEIQGLDAPATLSSLAEQTCRAAVAFLRATTDLTLTGTWPEPYPVKVAPFHLAVTRGKKLEVTYENRSDLPQRVALSFHSDHLRFGPDPAPFAVLPGGKHRLTLPVGSMFSHQPTAEFAIDVALNGQPLETLRRGLPRYGSWLLLGPFIDDDPALLPMDESYPDHGLSSLPSVRYMNHDRVNTDTDFLTMKDIRGIVGAGDYDHLPFSVERVEPDSFALDFSDCFYGKGERTLYLYSRLDLPEARRLWVSLACTAPFKLWLGDELVHTQTGVRRAWPGQTAVEFNFPAGSTDLLLKVDTLTDETRLEIGFKEHLGQHPHQSQWALVVPTV